MEHSYDDMQACLNGHVITSSFNGSPERRQEYCSGCGARTIHQCPECENRIRGAYLFFGEPGYSPDHAPGYCMHCGSAFPWTRQKIEALVELAAEEESLSNEDREILRDNAPLIATDNPKSELAALRIKRVMERVGEKSAPIFRKVIMELATEAVKSMLGL